MFTFEDYFNIFSLTDETNSYNFSKATVVVDEAVDGVDIIDDVELFVGLNDIDGQTFGSSAELKEWLDGYIAEYYPIISYNNTDIIIQSPELTADYRDGATRNKRLIINNNGVGVRSNDGKTLFVSVERHYKVWDTDTSGLTFTIKNNVFNEFFNVKYLIVEVLSNDSSNDGVSVLQYAGGTEILDIGSMMGVVSGEKCFVVHSTEAKKESLVITVPTITSGSIELQFTLVYEKFEL